MPKSAIILFMSSAILILMFQNCGKTEKNFISSETSLDLLEARIDELNDPEEEITFLAEANGEFSVGDQESPVGLSIAVQRKDIEFSGNKARVTGPFDIKTPFGPIHHSNSNLSLTLISGDGEGTFTLINMTGDVSLDLSNSPGLLRYFSEVEGLSVFEATISYALGKDLGFVNMPLLPEQPHYIYQFKAGFYAKMFGMDVDIPVAAVKNEFVIDPENQTFYFEGSIEGLPGLALPITRAGIGFSNTENIPFVPRSNFSFPDFFDFGEVNFWESILDLEDPEPSPINFSGNLFISGTGKLIKIKKVPLSIDGDMTFKVNMLDDGKRGALFGVNGEVFAGLKSDEININIPLGKATVSAGVDEEQSFFYVSGEIQSGFKLSPFGVDLDLGPGVAIGGLIHSEENKSFYRLKQDLKIGALNLLNTGLQIDSEGVLLGGKLDFGLAQPAMSGKIDRSGVELKGAINVKIPMKGTKQLLTTVVDGALCGTVKVIDGVQCGYAEVVNGSLCGYELVTSGALCGYDSVTDGALCGYHSITSVAKCGEDILASGLDCVARIAQGKSCKSTRTCTNYDNPKSCNKGPASSCHKGPAKSCQDFTQPNECDIDNQCDIVTGRIPDTFFGEANLTMSLAIRGTDQPGLTYSIGGQYCDALQNCGAIDVDLVDVDLSVPEVCVNLDVTGVAHDEARICADL